MRRAHRTLRSHCMTLAIVLLYPLMFVSLADAWEVTFSRTAAGNNSAGNFNLRVVLEQQTNSPAGVPAMKVKGDCIIPWDGESCTISNFPTTTNALVTVFHVTQPFSSQRAVIGKIQFWTQIGQDADIHIPTGVGSFKANMTWGELADSDCCNIAILPQGDIEMGESFSSRPNSGGGYFGQKLGNCGSRQLGSDQPEFTCTIDFLAGCYSPVFARGISDSEKAKIWVNRADDEGADTSLCINDGQVSDYTIKVQ